MKVIGSIVNGAANVASTLLQNRANKKMQEKSFKHNTEMWHLNNQYNTPEMQMKRLRDAGLNPNLVYGSGTVTGNTSTQTPKYQAPELQRIPLEQVSPLQVLGAYADLREKNAQAKKAESEAAWIDSEKSSAMVKNGIQAQQLARLMGVNWTQKKVNNKWETYFNIPEKNPFMNRYNTESRLLNQKETLNKFQIDFMKSIPKSMQWAAPLFLNLIRSTVK